MAINYPGPFEIRIFQQSSAISPGGILPHVTRFNVVLSSDPPQADTFDNYTVIPGGGVAPTLDTVVEDLLGYMAPLFHTSRSFGPVELWKYPVPQSFEAVYWATYEPTVSAGTGGQEQAAEQSIWTFRTEEGGIMKVSLMETIRNPGSRLAYAAMTTQEKALVDFILGRGSETYGAPFVARDTSYPISEIALFPGQNEALFKKRFR